MACNEERNWRETLADDSATEGEARQGRLTPNEVDPKMLHDIQTVLSRLVGKASQLLGNNTTNLAECWMHIRSKFDGGKVINAFPEWLVGAQMHGGWFTTGYGC